MIEMPFHPPEGQVPAGIASIPTPCQALCLCFRCLYSSQFDLQDRLASSVVRVLWCGGRLSGSHRKNWERQSQGLLETSDTTIMARSQQSSINWWWWWRGVLIILLPPLSTRRNEHAGTSVANRCQEMLHLRATRDGSRERHV